MTIYLIDGTAQAYRAFHAIPPLSASNGFPTNAIVGFINMLRKLMQDESPEFIGVAFDVGRRTFRTEMFEAYKAHRPETPDELKQQMPKIKEFVRLMNMPLYEMEGFEADDVLATLAKKAEAQGVNTVIVSSDKDLLQLVSEKVVTLSERMGHKAIYTPEKVIEKYGVRPEQMRDFLGLVGDTSDNIPGIEGIGPKTASELLQQFGTLEEVLNHPDAVKNKKQRANLENGRDIALQSKTLATVRTDVPVEFNLDDLRRKTPDYQGLRPFLHDLELYALMRDMIPANAGGALPSNAGEQSAKTLAKSYRAIQTEAQLAELVAELRQSGGFAVDTETTSEHPMLAELVGISVSTQPHAGAYIPVAHRYLGAPPQLPLDAALRALKPLLEDETLPKFGQNIKYDMLVLGHYGVQIKGVTFDSMVASYVLNPSRHSHGMDHLAEEFLHYRTITFEEVVGKGANKATIDMMPVERVTEYAAEDADVTLQLTNALRPQIKQHGLEKLYEQIELPLIDVLATMERHGVRVDTSLLRELSSEFAVKLAGIEQEIYQLAGQQFNINSPKQLGPILFEKLQMPFGKKTKTGYSTDVDVLTDLARAGFPLPQKILDYRQLAKLKSTYSDALPKQINPKTGRIHTSYNQTVTTTGRLSSSDPNLQNIPIKTPEGRRIRQAFIPADGCVLLSADYSQIELRILAHVTGDDELIKAYQRDEDIHAKTAMRIFGLPADQITPAMRREAKTVNFSVIYGISAFSLAKDLNIPRGAAQRYIDGYFDFYKGVRKYVDETIAQAQKDGYVTTLLNRIRYIPDINSKNASVRQFAERTAVNTPIQGTAADMIKLAMLALHARLLRDFPAARMMMQVHDELVFEAPEAQAEPLREVVVEQMSSVLKMRVPMKVEAHYGKNWDEAH